MNFIPFFIILFVGRSGPLQNLKPKLACTVATVTVFVAVSFPVIHTYARNSSLFHIVLLGLAAPYDANLDIGLPRPAYEYLYAYDDSYLQAVIQSYANRTHQGGAPLILLTPAYDRVCQEYFTRLVETFPGDMMTRAAASVVRVINLPFWMPDGHVPTGVTNPTLVWLWERRASVLQAFLGTGGGLVAATLVVIGIAGLRFTLIGFVLLWFWAAYPVIEFQGRHIFQFEFLILAALALGSSVVWWSVVQPTLSRGAEAALTILPHVFRAAATVAVLFAAVGGALAIARLIQIPRARALLMSYIDAPADPIPLKIVPLHDGRARLVVDVFKAPSARNEVQEAMVEAEFNPGPCGRPSDIAATFRYEQADPLLGLDFSRETKLELRSGAPTRVFFPAYSFRRDGQTLSRFIGVDVPSAVSTCVRLSQMRDLDRFPLLLPATLTPDWQRRLYQRLRVDPIPVS